MWEVFETMKTILIPTDFSENSQNAVKYALDYFADIPVDFYILHVSLNNPSVKEQRSEVLSESSGEGVSQYNPSMQLESDIENYKLLSKNSMHNFYPLHENEVLVEAIRSQIKQKEIDLLLMGTKGDSALCTGEMGSNTYEVITKVKCPIMVIPEHAYFNGIKNIAFATDYNSIYRNKVMSTLTEALYLHNAPLRVLHIKSKNAQLTASQIDNRGFLHYFLKDTRHSFHLLEITNLESGIQNFVDTWEISMVAIAAKNLNFIQKLMLRPSIKTINYHTEVPFLVLHE